jgi:hypothetical protein
MWHGHGDALAVLLDWPGVRFDLRGLDGRTPEELGRSLGYVEHTLRILGTGGDIRVQRQRPVDLDDMDRDELGLRCARDSGSEANDARIAWCPGQGKDGPPKGRWLWVGHEGLLIRSR